MKVQTLTQRIDNISEWTGKIFNWVVIPLTIIVLVEITASKAFHLGLPWAFEVTTFLYGFHFMIVAAYTLLYKGHVSIDIIVNRLPPKTRFVIDLVCYSFFFFFLASWLVCGTRYAWTSWAIMEHSHSSWSPPLYPIKTVIPLTAVLLIMQGISDFAKKIIAYKRGGNP